MLYTSLCLDLSSVCVCMLVLAVFVYASFACVHFRIFRCVWLKVFVCISCVCAYFTVFRQLNSIKEANFQKAFAKGLK